VKTLAEEKAKKEQKKNEAAKPSEEYDTAEKKLIEKLTALIPPITLKPPQRRRSRS
jgi:hypothetical protein